MLINKYEKFSADFRDQLKTVNWEKSVKNLKRLYNQEAMKRFQNTIMLFIVQNIL